MPKTFAIPTANLADIAGLAGVVEFDVGDATVDFPDDVPMTVFGEVGTYTQSAPVLNLSLTENADGDPVIDGASGTVTFTITAPPIYATYDAGNGAGVFTFDTADLVDGPEVLVPVRFDASSASVNDFLAIIPALSVFDGDNDDPISMFEVLRDGVSVTGPPALIMNTYTVQAADQGATLTLRETITGDNGVTTVVSAGIAVPAAPVGPSTAVRHLGEQVVLNVSNVAPTTSIDVSELTAGEILIFPYGAVVPSGATVNGNAAALIHTIDHSFTNTRGGVFTYVLQAADIDDGNVNVVANGPGNNVRHCFDFYVAPSGSTVTATSVFEGENPLSMNVTTNSVDDEVALFLFARGDGFGGVGFTFPDAEATRLHQTVGAPVQANLGIAAAQYAGLPVGPNTLNWNFDAAPFGHVAVAIVVS